MALSFDELIADAPTAPGPEPQTLQPLQTVPPDADDQVELALFRRATGGTTWVEALDRNGLPVKLERDMPPDPKAAQAWLQARRPAQWGALAQGIQAAVTINLIGVDRAKHVKVARVIEHESPEGGPIETPGEGDPRIEIGGGSVLEDPSAPDIPLLDLTTSKKITG